MPVYAARGPARERRPPVEDRRQGDEGNVGGVKGAKPGSALVKPGEWNQFKLTVQGEKVELEINGQPAWKGEGLQGVKEGFIALQAEVPGGGQFRFRNIFITTK